MMRPEVGQVYEDRDRRENGRQVRVTEVEGDYVTAVAHFHPNKPWLVGKQHTKVSLEGLAKRWRLVQ